MLNSPSFKMRTIESVLKGSEENLKCLETTNVYDLRNSSALIEAVECLS